MGFRTLNAPIRFLLTGALMLALWSPPQLAWAQDSPDAVVRTIMAGIADNRPQVFWESLPASYQKDVEDVIHQAAHKTDPQLYQQSFTVLTKLVRILDEKRSFIMGHPMVASQLESAPVDVNDSVYDEMIGVLRLITNSEISSLERMKALDVGQFLSGTVSQLMGRLRNLSALVPGAGDELDDLESAKVTLVSNDGERAVIRIEDDDEEPEEQELVRVEGKWVPAELADEWDANISQLRQQLEVLPSGGDSEQNAAMMATLQGFEASLDPLLAAQTAEEFNSALEGLIGMAMMQLGALTTQTQ